jgi:hypothetical protein
VNTGAYQDLLASLGATFRSVKDPDCLRYLGPRVPGATLTQGARVPGTSLELDPATAAFNLGAMMGGVALAAILPVADFLARKAHNEARPPLCVQDVLSAMSEARHRGQLGHPHATAAVLARLAGANGAHITDALRPGPPAPPGGTSSRWAAGDAAARAVRLAFGAPSGAPEATCPPPVARERCALPGSPQQEDFGASVAALFPAKQAALIASRVADPAAVLAMPVHEFIAMLVRNG